MKGLSDKREGVCSCRDNDYQSSVYLSTARHILASSGERIRQKGTGRLDNTENLGRVESKQFPSSAKQVRPTCHTLFIFCCLHPPGRCEL